jgi:hypothetical protein
MRNEEFIEKVRAIETFDEVHEMLLQVLNGRSREIIPGVSVVVVPTLDIIEAIIDEYDIALERFDIRELGPPSCNHDNCEGEDVQIAMMLVTSKSGDWKKIKESLANFVNLGFGAQVNCSHGALSLLRKSKILLREYCDYRSTKQNINA